MKVLKRDGPVFHNCRVKVFLIPLTSVMRRAPSKPTFFPSSIPFGFLLKTPHHEKTQGRLLTSRETLLRSSGDLLASILHRTSPLPTPLTGVNYRHRSPTLVERVATPFVSGADSNVNILLIHVPSPRVLGLRSEKIFMLFQPFSLVTDGILL